MRPSLVLTSFVLVLSVPSALADDPQAPSPSENPLAPAEETIHHAGDALSCPLPTVCGCQTGPSNDDYGVRPGETRFSLPWVGAYRYFNVCLY